MKGNFQVRFLEGKGRAISPTYSPLKRQGQCKLKRQSSGKCSSNIKSIFISLSNEKEMGVFSFIDALEKYAPGGFIWDYVHYKNESHNSLGFKSMCAGFEMIYKNWKPEDKK